MTDVKNITLLDLSDKSNPLPRLSTDNVEFNPGQRVLVQTQQAKDLEFFILLEVVDNKQGEEEKYIGKVVGQEGYQGLNEIIYPGIYAKLGFDNGLTLDELVSFKQKNVWHVIR